ncbi:dihydrofolate reductase family protein [Lutimonas sp.]|uniref:dihydrofolate reductase family protein n=1 Tax=Lutimonas sp. TaxID=1872403 RepID=UPI003D9BCDAA
MRNIIYYVASSLDGYISGLDDDISGFVNKGNGIDQYFEDLQGFDTVIMGRKTYEFGYKFGMKPGSLPYPHMTHYIFSRSLEFKDKADQLHIKGLDIRHIEKLRKQEGSDIYLCGGGQFAGWLLDQQQITHLKIKLNPFVAGNGIRLFGSSSTFCRTELINSQSFEEGLQILTYRILY